MARLFTQITLCFAVGLSACSTTQSTHITTSDPKKPVVALVLGGGGAKGFAHVGVIDALAKHNIHPDIIIGTSAGAVVGALYAHNPDSQALMARAYALTTNDVIKISPAHQGLLDGTPIKDYTNHWVNQTPMQSLKIRFGAVVTETATKQPVLLTQGDTGLAVQASSAVDKLFVAPRIGADGYAHKYGTKYTDGGQTALVPARFAKQLGADVVIAVDVLADKPAIQDDNSATIEAKRTESGYQVTGFGQTHTVDFSTIFKEKSNDHPLAQSVQGLLETAVSVLSRQLPEQVSMSVPSEANIGALMAKMQGNAAMSEVDVRASDVIITPKLGEYSVVDGILSDDTTNRAAKEAMIEAGYVATMDKLAAIQQAIARANP